MMPKGSTQVPCDWWIACTKSGAVNSSHFAERPDCETAWPAKKNIKRATTNTLRTAFIVHLGFSKQAIVIRATHVRHTRELRCNRKMWLIGIGFGKPRDGHHHSLPTSIIRKEWGIMGARGPRAYAGGPGG